MLTYLIQIRAMLLGVRTATNYETKQPEGISIELGYRINGRFITQTIKILDAKLADYEILLDEIVEFTLEDVTVNAYMRDARAALSIKAKKATVEVIS